MYIAINKATTRALGIWVLLLVASCETNKTPSWSDESITARIQQMPSTLQEGLKAHGGLEEWGKYGTLNYTVASKNIPEDHLVDLSSRKVLITTDSTFTMGFDGQDVWVSPNLATYPGSSPTFYHNLVFYFFSLPFVVADPGVNYTALPDITFDGVAHSRISISFGDNVGESPDDQYILWFRKSDHLLSMINYSVTYFDAANASKFNAMVYDEWQTVNGLKVPKKWTSYKWENDSLGEKRGATLITDVSFQEGAPDGTLFQKPETAEIDNKGN
jgi:hypothetical protein